MVSLDGVGARRKSKKISGQRPNRPSKLGLCKSGHLSYDLGKLIEDKADVVEGKDATTAIGNDELGITGVAM